MTEKRTIRERFKLISDAPRVIEEKAADVAILLKAILMFVVLNLIVVLVKWG